MVRFEFLEGMGVSLALMTDASDGDCSPRGDIALREQVCAHAGIVIEDLVCTRQVHGKDVAMAREEDRGRGVRAGLPAFSSADAIVTNVARLPLAIFTADCVPVYVFDPNSRSIGLIHAGREGTWSNIVGATVRCMADVYGARAGTMYAFVGPSAGPCCYEVDEARASSFAAAGWPVQGRHLDLWSTNALQLAQAGLSEARITVSRVCTICGETYHSHRRCGDGGRNMSILML